MTARPLAWMRKYWPLTMTAAYLLCHALIYLLGWLWNLPPENPRHFRNGLDIPGAVLFGATFFGMRWALFGRRRILGVAVVAISLLGQGWRIYRHFDTAHSASFLAEMRSGDDSRISRLPEVAMRRPRDLHGRSGFLTAQFYFEMTGVAIPYRDESNEVRMFEPSAKALTMRENETKGRELLEKSRPMFRAYATTFRWFGYSGVLMAAALAFGAMGLFPRRKPHVALDPVANPPVPGQ